MNKTTAKWLCIMVAAMILTGCAPKTEPTVPTDPSTIATNPTQGPTNSTQMPTQLPVDPTEATQASTTVVTDPAEIPTNPTDPTAISTNPTNPTEIPTNPTQAPVVPTSAATVPATSAPVPTQPTEAPVTPPTAIPPSVTIPPETDPETGDPEPITFPCQVPNYGLIIEKIAPYSGMYVENGSNAAVQNVAMLLLYNDGDYPIEYTQISISYGEETLLFDVSALPIGELLVVQEKNGKAIPEGDVTFVGAAIVQRADMEMSEGKVSVTDNGDNTLTITNLTGETIPTVRVFYKYYMEAEDIFVGGIAFTVRITRLNAGASITIQPSHYASETCRVVMVLTYDSEV